MSDPGTDILGRTDKGQPPVPPPAPADWAKGLAYKNKQLDLSDWHDPARTAFNETQRNQMLTQAHPAQGSRNMYGTGRDPGPDPQPWVLGAKPGVDWQHGMPGDYYNMTEYAARHGLNINDPGFQSWWLEQGPLGGKIPYSDKVDTPISRVRRYMGQQRQQAAKPDTGGVLNTIDAVPAMGLSAAGLPVAAAGEAIKAVTDRAGYTSGQADFPMTKALASDVTGSFDKIVGTDWRGDAGLGDTPGMLRSYKNQSTGASPEPTIPEVQQRAHGEISTDPSYPWSQRMLHAGGKGSWKYGPIAAELAATGMIMGPAGRLLRPLAGTPALSRITRGAERTLGGVPGVSLAKRLAPAAIPAAVIAPSFVEAHQAGNNTAMPGGGELSAPDPQVSQQATQEIMKQTGVDEAAATQVASGLSPHALMAIAGGVSLAAIAAWALTRKKKDKEEDENAV